MTPIGSLKQPICVYTLTFFFKETVNNLFSQTIFNHPFKYLCRRLCVESCPLGFQMATNKGGQEKKRSTNRRSIETEQFEDERC